MNLTDPQERALIFLADRRDDKSDAEQEWIGGTSLARNARTLDALAKQGLIETRERPMTTVARITDKGYELVRSMGD